MSRLAAALSLRGRRGVARAASAVDAAGPPPTELAVAVESVAAPGRDLAVAAADELRGPIAGIRGAAVTLERFGDHIAPAERQALLAAIVERSDRLTRLLESLVAASHVLPPARPASSSLDMVLGEAVGALAAPDRAALRLSVGPELWVACGDTELRQVMDLLVHHAVAQRAPTGPVLVSGRARARDVVLEVRTPVGRAACAEGLSSRAARLIAEAHGGTVDVRVDNGCLRVEVALPAGRRRAAPEPEPRRVRALVAAAGSTAPSVG